jgi:hypothetical protein
VPRRAMIRRRGKRSRIRRAEAVKAYENDTLLTNDARGLSKKDLGTVVILLVPPPGVALCGVGRFS